METTRWLDETEAGAWRGHLCMSWLLAAAVERDLVHEAGLSSADYQVLVALSEHPDHRMRMTELAAGMLWSKSRLSHQIARMEARGLVRREGCPGDARGAFAVLTATGLQVIQEAAPGHVESIRRHLLSALTSEQIAALAGITQAVVGHLSGARASQPPHPLSRRGSPQGD
jgi:DNA-binding MarR family transcriptional regulator